MDFTVFVDEEQKELLEYEVVSSDLKDHLTRIIDRKLDDSSRIYDLNIIVNKARTIAGLSRYVLKANQWGEYHSSEYAWHEGELRILFHRLNTTEFVELICELVEGEWLSIHEVNDLLRKDGRSFWLEESGRDVQVRVNPIGEVEEDESDGHPNIRVLVNRMENQYEEGDYSGVIHSSASIFETLAKDIIGSQSIQNESLGGFFEKYRNESDLPEDILDYIEDIYDDRNVTPLAGHGSIDTPSIDETQATSLVEMTKAFVRVEYKLREPTTNSAT